MNKQYFIKCLKCGTLIIFITGEALFSDFCEKCKHIEAQHNLDGNYIRQNVKSQFSGVHDTSSVAGYYGY